MSDWEKVWPGRIKITDGEATVAVEATCGEYRIESRRSDMTEGWRRLHLSPQAAKDLANAILECEKTKLPLTDCIPVDPRRERLDAVKGILNRFPKQGDDSDQLILELLISEVDRLTKELDG
jgi:hypothetical protein